MHRLRFPKIILLFSFFVWFVTAPASGQTRTVNEIDISRCWQYTTGGIAGRALTTDGERVYLGLEGAKVDALSLEGKKLWSTEFGGEITSNLLAAPSGLFLTTSSMSPDPAAVADTFVRGVSKDTGITNWTFKLPSAEKHFLRARNGDVIVVSMNGVIHSLDSNNGELRWRREIAKAFSVEPVFIGKNLLAATTDNQIFVVSLSTGEIESMRRSVFAVTALGEKSTGENAVGDVRGNVSIHIDGAEKPYWKFKSGGAVSALIASGENVLAASNDNFIYLLAGRNGSLVWKKRFSGRITQIGVVFDRFAAVSSFEEHSIALVDLKSGKVAGQLALAADEIAVQGPIYADGITYLLTTTSIYAISLNGCKGK